MWCDKAFEAQAREIITAIDPDVRVDIILAGKFRRYYGIPLFRQLLRFSDIVLPNIIDAFKILAGFVQSFVKMIAWRPDVVFCKGGFVCLPAGIAAFLLRIPVVLHDSDAHPGLTNRVLSRVASYIATGASLDNYQYPVEKASYVGIPISSDFRMFSKPEADDFKKKLGFDTRAPLVVVTGGGLGAKPINDTVVDVAGKLTKDINMILITGTNQYAEIKEKLATIPAKKVKIFDFVSKGMVEMLGAADVVVARAGATTLLELAALGKPTVLIPNPNLTGGHQLKNAEYYEKNDACVMVSEEAMLASSTVFFDAVRSLAMDAKHQERLSLNIHRLAMPHAADDVARLLYKAAHQDMRRKEAA